MKRLALLLPLFFACENAPEFYPTPSDRVAEAVVSGADIEGFEQVDGWRVSPVLAAPLGATRVGLLARLNEGANAPRIEARVIADNGAEGSWQPLVTTWSEDGQFVARVDLEFAARAAQIRFDSGASVDHVIWSALVPERGFEEELPAEPALPASEIGSVTHALRAELAGLVRPREDWGARATRCTSRDESKTRMAVHHTVSAAMGDPIGILRGIQNFHMDTRGWCDVGYHFLVTLDGTVWEARPLEMLGSHVLNHNTGNIGVSFVGCYDSDHPDCRPLPPGTPPDEMLAGAARVIGRLAELYSIPLTAERVMGHRDHAGASTVCPGGDLHALLGELREDAGGTGAAYGAMYVSQSFPLASADFILAPGEVQSGFIEMRNTGTETWRPEETFLATTEPRLSDSPLEADDWVAPNRPVGVDSVVAPGETGRFEFNVRAPDAAGDYSQYFGIIQLGELWFSDVGQGGPPDDQLQIRVTVSGDAPRVDAGPGMDAGLAMDAGPGMDAGTTDGGMALDAGTSDPGDLESGCGCVVAGGTSNEGSPWALLAFGALFLRRRQR